MLDINLLRNDVAAVAAALAKRGATLEIGRFEALEAARKDIQMRTQDLQSRRNAASKEIGIAKSKGADAAPLLAQFPEERRAWSLFIVDPLGNLMMRHDAAQTSKDLLTDLKKLLKLSHIG